MRGALLQSPSGHADRLVDNGNRCNYLLLLLSLLLYVQSNARDYNGKDGRRINRLKMFFFHSEFTAPRRS